MGFLAVVVRFTKPVEREKDQVTRGGEAFMDIYFATSPPRPVAQPGHRTVTPRSAPITSQKQMRITFIRIICHLSPVDPMPSRFIRKAGKDNTPSSKPAGPAAVSPSSLPAASRGPSGVASGFDPNYRNATHDLCFCSLSPQRHRGGIRLHLATTAQAQAPANGVVALPWQPPTMLRRSRPRRWWRTTHTWFTRTTATPWPAAQGHADGDQRLHVAALSQPPWPKHARPGWPHASSTARPRLSASTVALIDNDNGPEGRNQRLAHGRIVCGQRAGQSQRRSGEQPQVRQDHQEEPLRRKTSAAAKRTLPPAGMPSSSSCGARTCRTPARASAPTQTSWTARPPTPTAAARI